MSVAALDDEIAELDAQIEKAQSEAATLGKRARQYADLSQELGKRALQADAQHQAELAAATEAPSDPDVQCGHRLGWCLQKTRLWRSISKTF